jgi:hypothetical protein
VTRSTESGHACGAGGDVVVVGDVVVADVVVGTADVVVVGCVGRADELDDGELVALPLTWIRPVAGGLDGARVASATSLAAPCTGGTSLPPSRAPMAQMNNTAPTAEPAVAMMRRRRYTDGGSAPLGSFTCGN